MRRSYLLLVVGLALVVIVLASACAPGPAEPQAQEGTPSPATATVEPYPPPATPDGTVAPPPMPTLIEVAPGDFRAPTPTPMPSFTPRPTPTRRPGPTPTPVPLPPIPDSPAGVIRYKTVAQPPWSGPYTYYAISTDAGGAAALGPEQIALPLSSEFSPFEVHFSPAGRYLVMMRPVEPVGRPYVVDELSGEVTTLFEPYGGGNFFGWHPDSRHFLFWIDQVGLWLVDADTLQTVTLALPQGPVQGAAISPDGLTIAFIDQDLPETLGALWFVSSEGSDAQPILDAGDISYLYPDAWSPDGRHIAYIGNCSAPSEAPDATGPLCLLDTSTLERRALDVPFVWSAPRWSPDGRFLAVNGAVEGWQRCPREQIDTQPVACEFDGRLIYLLDVVTGEAAALTEGVSPAWSPDGSLIAFLSSRSGAPEVWIVRPDGSGLRQLTHDGLFKSTLGELSWSRELVQ